MGHANKIIFIYIQGEDSNFPDETSDDCWIAGHTGMIALQLSKRYNSDLFESWRIDLTAHKYKQKLAYGVICKVFPSKTIPFWGPFSPSVFRQIYIEQKKYKIVIHVSSASNLIFYLIRLIFRNVKFVYSQMGERLYFIDTHKTLKKKIKLNLQKLFLKSVDHIFVASNEIYAGLLQIGVRKYKISFPEIGTDVNMFSPMEKSEARQLLHLPIEKKVILYIGRFLKERGVVAIIDSIPALKSIFPNLLIIMLGGNENDSCWDKVNKHQDITVYGYTKYELLPLFHNASDLSIRVDFLNEGPVSVGTNVFESLCCNTPVVSTTLKHFMNADVKKLGISPMSINDLSDAIIKVLKNSDHYNDCSQEVRNIYSWDNVCAEHLRVYNNLLS